MAPGLVGPEKAARGKTPTDVWWHTIVSPTGREKTGYPTQKPLKILERIVQGALGPGRPGGRLLRRQRHHRRGRGAQRPRLSARRLPTRRPSRSWRDASRGTSPSSWAARASCPDARRGPAPRGAGPRSVRRSRAGVTRGRSPRWGTTRRRSRSRRTCRRR